MTVLRTTASAPLSLNGRSVIWTAAVVVGLAAFSFGCGEDTAGVGSTNPDDLGAATADTGAIVDDVVGDTGSAPSDAGEAQDSGLITQDADVGAALECPGAAGCACQDGGDCDFGLCIDSGTAKVCAKPCVDSCDDGFSCEAVSTGGGDTASFCVPRFDRICAPCTSSTQCQTLGFDSNACMDRGADGGFCGVTCADDSGCPADYECTAGKTVEGATAKQCLPKDAADGTSTDCGCGEWATAKKSSTSCKIEVTNDKGELVSSCAGVRTCDATGLSKCVGDAPGGEICNGVDDDCDGETDESTCDDNNACTVDGCDPSADGGKGACVHNKLDGPCDADGSVCTENDACLLGVCTPGAAKKCSDGNDCTTDACDPASGCTVTDADGDNCDDDNPCTIGDTCAKGVCGAGPAKACAASDACVDAKCDLTTGKCKYADKPGGSACDDGSKCTTTDACNAGNCTGTTKNCDDANACTDDACKATEGCSYSDNQGPCEDGSKCTNGDLCATGKCVAGATKSCDDGNACTQRSCNPDDGACETKKLAVACDDESKCTDKDVCADGFCAGKAVDCDDKNPCTTDACQAKSGCTHTANMLPCDDANKCTDQDSCAASQCAGLPVEVSQVCDDNNVCTTPSCAADKGCVQSANTDVCSDGNVCTTGDRCKDKQCAAGTNTCDCQVDKDCATKEDGDLCNGTLFCDKSAAPFKCSINPKTVLKCPASGDACQDNVCDKTAGKCGLVAVADGSGCDKDGSVCTAKDSCSSGVCAAGTKLPCDDGKVCTDDSCDPKSGCVFLPNAASCDADGSVCTVGDSCKSGLCLHGPKKDCDDSNGCTDDSCDAKKGCVHLANAAQCDDGNPCTTKDACAAKVCKGEGLSCDDNNACTADSCTLGSGCANQATNGSCDDGDACTTADVCGTVAGGKWGCTAGKPADCDDNNVCTVDGCDSKTGCTKKLDNQTQHVCYSGAGGTAGTGTCLKGKANCKADATLGTCVGEVVPNKVEACDGKDDTCDGKTDEGCKAERATLGFGAAMVRASGAKYSVRAWTGGSPAVGVSSGEKKTVWWGFDRWLRRLVTGK